MRRKITVLDREKIRITKSTVTFSIDERPYNTPREYLFVDGDDIYVSDVAFNNSKLSELEPEFFNISEPIDPIYIDPDHTLFAPWFRKFQTPAGRFIVFGFDQEPKVTISSKYGAILATTSEEEEENLYPRLRNQFMSIDNALSLSHFEFIGDVYEILNSKESSEKAELLCPNFKLTMEQYLPEVFQTWGSEPQEKDYDRKGQYWSALQQYEVSAKAVFLLCRRRTDQNG